uniref:Protein kinase domain-containing protein n=1 Tax=Rhizophagus irregularis (strain DAOM 181602 / DAOM 197198 / MUCL 43194) TaxID=747089 RepID=U9SL83_RHIID
MPNKLFKNNFINWTSGNEKIDDFIQKKQLKISIESYIIFEWIPYNEFIEIKETEGNCLTTATWEKGPLIYDTLKKEWVKTSYKKVCLRYLYNSQNVTNEFIDKVESYLTDEKYYGVSQNSNTRDYILVFNNEYFDYHCEKCGNKCMKYRIWCEPCQINYLKNNFINWTSGNKKIDEFIQKMQLKINSTRKGETFEWIPYNEFININEMKGGIAIAIWEDGPLYYSNIKGKYKRKLNKKVLLKYLYNSQNINDTLLSKVAASIMESYGISQNPNTKEFILVLRPKNYCENCGKKYNNKFEIDNKNCMSCQTNHENKKISDLIQEMRLDLDHSKSNTIFEWIPYDQFDDIREIGKGGFSTVYSAIWKDGLLCRLYETIYRYERNPNTKVALKCLHGSQNLINEFIDKVKTYSNRKVNNIIKLYGISQDPDTKDYIIVLEYAEGGNFSNYLNKNYERFDWFNGLKILTNVIGGLSKIHQKQIVHCYFHMGNILFTKLSYFSDYKACISDMGLYRKIDDINETKIYGVIPFVAPEVLKEKSYTREADIFSFGMIMYVVATGRRPFDNCAHDEVLILNIYNGIRPEINNQIAPKCYIDLMKKCWDGNPDNRPNSIEIKEMIELFYNSLDQDFKKKEQQHYEIEEQFKETQESRKESLLSIKNGKSTTHAQAIYTSRLLNPFTKNISNSSTVEITDFKIL